MAKPKDNRKAVFTAIGEIRLEKGKKRLALLSPQHFQQQVSNLIVGKKYGVTVEEYKATRSSQQLAYYWVLMGYLAQYSGHSSEELHDAIMRQKFGVKKIKIGSIEQDVRRSISDAARFPKSDMVELIQTVLDLCAELDIRVPSKQELGYI